MASGVDGAYTLGPWGGSGGTAWSFENAQTITKIKISAGGAVDSITFQYMDGETARWSPRYGGDGGTPTEIELRPAEFIISMKGYYSTYRGYTVIYSLTFVTTIREYGPYGREQGIQFSIPKGTGWISGFHGRSGGLLDAIGVYKKTSFEASRVDGAYMLGPWGGSGGTAWSFENALTITKIKISVGGVVDSITFQYMDGETARWSPRYGGEGGEPTEIELEPAEFIISIKGYYSTYAEMIIIYSLTFVTTIREYGPYGQEQGTQFSVPKGTGWISGFHGRSDTLLDAIGVYKKTSFECGVVKVGPWGELKPQNLRDIEGIPTRLTKIIIRYSGCIESINFQYVADGVAKWSSNWGSESGSMAEIDLGNNHYLTAISGYYGNYHGCIVIRSLTFVTTMSTYGPYGPNEGTAFSFPMRAGKIVGFFGYAGQWLDALGFYLKPTSA